MKTILFYATLLCSVLASAASVSVGEENGQRYFRQQGCSTFANVINNIPEDYKVIPNIGSADRKVCGTIDVPAAGLKTIKKTTESVITYEVNGVQKLQQPETSVRVDELCVIDADGLAEDPILQEITK